MRALGPRSTIPLGQVRVSCLRAALAQRDERIKELESDLAALRPIVRAAMRHYASWDRSPHEMAEHDALEHHWHNAEGGCQICKAARALTPEQKARILESEQRARVEGT